MRTPERFPSGTAIRNASGSCVARAERGAKLGVYAEYKGGVSARGIAADSRDALWRQTGQSLHGRVAHRGPAEVSHCQKGNVEGPEKPR